MTLFKLRQMHFALHNSVLYFLMWMSIIKGQLCYITFTTMHKLNWFCKTKKTSCWTYNESLQMLIWLLLVKHEETEQKKWMSWYITEQSDHFMWMQYAFHLQVVIRSLLWKVTEVILSGKVGKTCVIAPTIFCIPQIQCYMTKLYKCIFY
jgi:hypothetical protein